MKKESLQKFYQTYRLYIFPSVVGFCCLILIGFIIMPQLLKLLDLQKNEQQSLKRSGILEAKAAELVNFDPEDIQKKVQIALNVLPSDKDYIGALALVQSIAEQNSFIADSLSLSETSGGGGSKESYIIRANITGPKILFLSLIKSLENSIRVMRVQSIEMTPAKEASAISAVIAIEVLYSTAQGVSGSADSPVLKLTAIEEQLINKLGTLLPATISTGNIATGGGVRGKQNPFQ